MFIGRKDELDYFNERYQSPGGELLVVYGRRRVGKTETLKEFARGKEHVFYTCTECSDMEQLQAYSGRMLGQNNGRYSSVFSGWRDALGGVEDLPGKGKKLLIIDEFPYMVRGNPSIPSILQELWDRGLKKENVMIILCGSAMSFIEKEILAEKNPLYGRATGILKMRPLGFYDVIRFFPSWSDTDRITAYAVLGGIPHYLLQFESGKGLAENIKKKILSRGSVLYNEVEFLMHQEMRETAIYNTIIAAVAAGASRFSEIHDKTMIDKNKLSVYLKNLISLDILRREFSLEEGSGIKTNVQRGLYSVSDPFFRFWYAFVFPNVSELEGGDINGIYRSIIAPALDEFVSRTYEEICREYLRTLNRQEKLPFHFSRIGRFWDKSREIDIMALGQDGGKCILGECKYRRSAFDLSDMKKTLAKWERPDEVYWYFFSRSGFTKGVMAAAAKPHLTLVSPAEMIKH
ncbi:ATPase AAA [Spirochaetia bacterium]|nr:ATPase AAA [Spirochaetia bacterium]